MSIEAMKLALDALNEAVAFREGGRQKAIDAVKALRAALSQQPATPERVPMAYEQIKAEFQRKQDELSEKGASANCPTDLIDFTVGIRFAEAHHGITAAPTASDA